MVVRKIGGLVLDPRALRRPGTKQGEVTAFGATPELVAFAPLVARAHLGARNSYESIDPATHCRVEIELVDSRGATRLQSRQALRRARRLIDLSIHPHICPVRSVLDLHDGHVAIVLAYRDWSLADAIANGWAASPAQAANVGLSVAGAIAAVHRAGMSHLGLCPENVLVAPGGNVELAGFAALVSGDVRLAPLDEGVELVRHAAPEVLEGLAAGPPADVYSLGSLLYEMLSGHAPFEVLSGESAAAFALRVLAEPALPLRVDIPDDLRELVASALAKSPSSRPSSSVEFSAALAEIRECNGWLPDGLSVPVTEDASAGSGRGAESTVTGIETAVVPGAERSSDKEAMPSAEDRSWELPSRLRGSRRALEPPLGDARRTGPLPSGRRGQPQLPLKEPEEPLDALELLKPPTPVAAVIPEAPSRADVDSFDPTGAASRHLGVGVRWGRGSPGRKNVASADRAGAVAQVRPVRGPVPGPHRHRSAARESRGEPSGQGNLTLLAKALVAAAAMVITLVALVVLGVI